jgi:hypothetical protein
MKPEPLTVTDVEGGPEVGEKTTLGVTLKVLYVAVWAGSTVPAMVKVPVVV